MRCIVCPMRKDQKCKCEYCTYDYSKLSVGDEDCEKTSTKTKTNLFRNNNIKGKFTLLYENVTHWSDSQLWDMHHAIHEELAKRKALRAAMRGENKDIQIKKNKHSNNNED